MVHVRLASNGDYWQALWVDPANGRRRGKGLGPKAKVNRRTAQAMVQRLAIDLEHNHQAADKVPGLSAWVREYIGLCDSWSENTLRENERDLKHMVKFFGSDRRIDSITRRDVEGFRQYLAEGGRADETVRKILRHCSACFGDRRGAVGMELVNRNPFAGVSKSPRPQQQTLPYYPPESFDDVMEACPDSRWRALIGLARFAGLRHIEITNLRWADIDFDRQSITVQPRSAHKTTKSAVRTVPITPDLAPILHERYTDAEPGDERVLRLGTGGKQTAKVRSLLEGCGLVGIPKPLHTLRAMCRVDWASVYPELDVRAWIGHTSEVGFRHYHQTHSTTWDRVTGKVYTQAG